MLQIHREPAYAVLSFLIYLTRSETLPALKQIYAVLIIHCNSWLNRLS